MLKFALIYFLILENESSPVPLLTFFILKISVICLAILFNSSKVAESPSIGIAYIHTYIHSMNY